MKDYEKIIRIGRGGFGKVWAAYDKKNNRKVAIKIIDLNEYISFVESREEKKFTPKQKQRYLNDINEMIPKEVTNMILMKCEYSVKFIDLIKEDNIYNMIMELCDSDLFHIIRDNKGLTIKQIYQILLQLNIAFKEMVRNNIIHRDIKPHNILIKYTDQSETRFNVKLSDYGISKIMSARITIRHPRLLMKNLIPTNATYIVLELRYIICILIKCLKEIVLISKLRMRILIVY